MVDVEADTTNNNQRPAGAVNNPYGNVPPMLPAHHPVNILKRTLYMMLSLYGIHYFKAYHTIIHSPHVRHEWFKIGLAATSALLMVKAYVEMYAGKLMKQKVSYETFPQCTHAVMGLFTLSTIAYNVALWPVYGSKSMFILTLVGAFILNFCLIMPTSIQNLVAFSLFTFFIQQYQ